MDVTGWEVVIVGEPSQKARAALLRVLLRERPISPKDASASTPAVCGQALVVRD